MPRSAGKKEHWVVSHESAVEIIDLREETKERRRIKVLWQGAERRNGKGAKVTCLLITVVCPGFSDVSISTCWVRSSILSASVCARGSHGQ